MEWKAGEGKDGIIRFRLFWWDGASSFFFLGQFLSFVIFFFCMDLSLGGFLIEVDETGKNFAILANLWESYLSTPCVLGWL